MKPNILGSNIKTIMAFMLLTTMLWISSIALAATHNIHVSAETLPNGQYGYKMLSHTSSDGLTPVYPDEATIPGPTVFVKEGDVLKVTLTNNTGIPVGLSPGSTETPPDDTRSYTYTANQSGTYAYYDKGSHLVGLFGALIVDKADGPVDNFIDENGHIIPANRTDLDKEFVMFMIGSTFWGAEIANGNQTPLWTNPTLGAVQDDIVRFHVLSLGPGHTWHLHAHRWPDNTNSSAIIDAKLLKDNADSHTFTIKSGAGVGTGFWQYHCHLVSHMEAGMTGKFHVVAAGESGHSIAGASPSGLIFLNPFTDTPGLVTFEITDEPGRWFRSVRSDILSPITKSRSLEVIPPGGSVHFIMSDTNAVHTISSLLWPSDANDLDHGDHRVIPFTQTKAYKGGAILRLDTPGLYVFTCKIHPYMFGAVIVDDPATEGLDLGESIDIVTGIYNLPTSSDLATRLLRTFFLATVRENWQDYTSTKPWHPDYPSVAVRISGGAVVNLKTVLESRYGQDIKLASLFKPTTPGVGEVWINTQFEKTAGKTKPGTITVLDASTWKIKRKIALPEINMNHPHNMWSNRDQSIIFQTQWFDDKLTFINRENGKLINNIRIGNTPSHVVTLPTNDDITVAINGENGVRIIPAGTMSPEPMIMTQLPGQIPANPHGHWVTADGKLIVTPNVNTSDIGLYNAATGKIVARTSSGGVFPEAPHPLAVGVGVDKIYTTNLLDHSINVTGYDGTKIKTINLIADYDPVSPTNPDTVKDRDEDGLATVGVLPIQTPVDPTGRVVVTANTGDRKSVV